MMIDELFGPLSSFKSDPKEKKEAKCCSLIDIKKKKMQKPLLTYYKYITIYIYIAWLHPVCLFPRNEEIKRERL